MVCELIDCKESPGKKYRKDGVGAKGCYNVDNAASLATLLVGSLPEILEWSEIHCVNMEEIMELMVSWLEDMRGMDNKNASLRDFPQLKMRIIEVR